ncbi:hypothetical protein AB1Y20_019758 [Prymnesium parvum]|uniref:Uncharacterized protein n=1 Tax=Prymnesium parvum TaxID=97485 RepID=A0AB34JV06_PRYPA
MFLLSACTAARDECPVAVPRSASSTDWRSICDGAGKARQVSAAECCKVKALSCSKGCGLNAVEAKGPNRTQPCAVLPARFLERSYQIRRGPAVERALHNVRSQLTVAACSAPPAGKEPRLHVGILGGSVTAGSWSRSGSWTGYLLEYMIKQAAADGTALSRRVSKMIHVWPLPTTGMGASYMGSCFPRHISEMGGRDPDVVIVEFDVNEFEDDGGTPMGALLRVLLQRGIVVLILHHSSPLFMVGAHPGRIKITAEEKHTRAAEFYGVSGISVRLGTGLIGNVSLTPAEVLNPCAFACGFSPDMLHPIECGSRLLAQMAAYALWQTLKAAMPKPGGCNAVEKTGMATRRCSELSGMTYKLARSTEASAHFRAAPCASVMAIAECSSVTGKPETWSLFPSCPPNRTSWRMVDLKAHHKQFVQHAWGVIEVHNGMNRNGYQLDSNRGVQVYKYLWEGRRLGASFKFALDCLRNNNTGYLRIMYMQSGALKYGRAAVSVGGQLLGIVNAHVEKKPSMFLPADFALPHGSKMGAATVTITVLDHDLTRGQGGGIGFGINAAVCLPRGLAHYYLVNSTRLLSKDEDSLRPNATVDDCTSEGVVSEKVKDQLARPRKVKKSVNKAEEATMAGWVHDMRQGAWVVALTLHLTGIALGCVIGVSVGCTVALSPCVVRLRENLLSSFSKR